MAEPVGQDVVGADQKNVESLCLFLKEIERERKEGRTDEDMESTLRKS